MADARFSHVRDCFWSRHAGVGRLKLFGLQSRISICWHFFSRQARPSHPSHTGLSKETRLSRRPHTHGYDLRDVRMTITTISASDHHPQRTRVGQIATARATQPAARRNLRHSPRTFAHRTVRTVQLRPAAASVPEPRRYLAGISPVSRRYLTGISPVSHRD